MIIDLLLNHNFCCSYIMPILELRHAGHDDDDMGTESESDNINLAKGLTMAVLFLTSFTLGVLPIKLARWFHWESNARNNTYVKMLLGFGGGVLFCTTFLHLLPEVSENFDDLNLTPNLEIPYAELLMCTGFFIMYFVEECVHLYLYHKQKNKNEITIKRSLSIRRGDEIYHNAAPEKKGSLPSYGSTENSYNKSFDHIHADHSHVDHSHADHSHADHSHVVDFEDNSTIAIIRGLLVVLALSIHELFEGLSIGLENATRHVWYMFGAVAAHKLVIAFCIGVELVSSGLKNTIVVAYIFTFAVVSPLGIGIGIILTNDGASSTAVASVFLQGLASGTLLYVVFFEILQADKKHGLKQYCAILGGFVIMFGITMLDA